LKGKVQIKVQPNLGPFEWKHEDTWVTIE